MVGDDRKDRGAGRNIRAPSKINPQIGVSHVTTTRGRRPTIVYHSVRFEKSINQPDCSGFVSISPRCQKVSVAAAAKKKNENKKETKTILFLQKQTALVLLHEIHWIEKVVVTIKLKIKNKNNNWKNREHQCSR